SDYSNGSRRLRKQSRYSYDGYDTRPGWQLALNQRYYFGQSNNGEVELSHITTSDWGARWRHEQLFGSSTHTYLSLDSPTHKDLYARAEMYHSMPIGDLSLSTYGSMLPNVPTTMQSRLYFRMKPGKIKNPNISYYWSTNVGWSYYGANSYLEPGIDLQVIPAAVKLGKATNLQFNMGSGYSITQSGTGPTAQASASLIRRIGRGSNASLRYSYYYSGRTSEYYGATSSQSVTGQFFMGGSKHWNSALTATYLPNSDDLSIYGSLIYSPFRNWRLELRPTFSSYGGSAGIGSSTTTNLDIYLAHQIGGRDVGLRWSTLDNRIRVELGTTALRF
ncbi:MAG TPA: hypothetical protein VHR86_07545, partial [Armatimonadota bacterium]|nr:hypothetical protein [Armatimonadota bacterium]